MKKFNPILIVFFLLASFTILLASFTFGANTYSNSYYFQNSNGGGNKFNSISSLTLSEETFSKGNVEAEVKICDINNDNYKEDKGKLCAK